MRILIIEDDKKIVNALTKGLKSEGFAVDSANDGETGEELAFVNDYDVIILDLMLPKQDGWTTCKNLREEKILTPILMLTALDDVEDRIKGLNLGADDYLPKPFHFGELLARLRSLIRRNSEERTTVLEHFGITLNLDSHTAFREGKEISLTTKEFALLELFMLNPNKILSQSRIIEHLWDLNFDPKSNVLVAFIKYLRKKIDKDFDKQLIHTVRGSGYIFSDKDS